MELLLELNKLKCTIDKIEQNVCTQLLKIVFDFSEPCYYYVYKQFDYDLFSFMVSYGYKNTEKLEVQLLEKFKCFSQCNYNCTDIRCENIFVSADKEGNVLEIFIHDFDLVYCSKMDDGDRKTSYIYYIFCMYMSFLFRFSIHLEKLHTELTEKKDSLFTMLDNIGKLINKILEKPHDVLTQQEFKKTIYGKEDM